MQPGRSIKLYRHLITVIMLLPLTIFGQQFSNIKFDRLTTENIIRVKGLSQNTIFSIYQDSIGFMWFGTWDGLNKYDGYTFTIYNLQSGLSNTTIRSIIEDHRGNLWIGTDNGLNSMDRVTGLITTFQQNPETTNSLSNNSINDIFVDKNDELWISTAYGLNMLNREYNTFTSFYFYSRQSDSIQANFITRTIGDDNDNLWVATHFGVFKYDRDQHVFDPYYFNLDGNATDVANSNYIQDIMIDHSGSLWVATRNGIFILDPATGKYSRLDRDFKIRGRLSSDNITRLLEDRLGHIWIGTDHMLNLYLPEKDSIIRYYNSGNSTSLSDNDIRSLYEDRSGTIWVGTYKGVNKADQSPSRFTNFRADPDDPNSLTNNIVYAIFEHPEGKIWLGTYGGVNIMDQKTGKFTSMQHQADNPNSLSSNKIRCMLRDRQGFYWFGTESAGLNRYDEKTRTFKLFVNDPQDPNSISDNNIFCVFQDSKGKIWVGTQRGVNIYDPATGYFSHLTRSIGARISLSSNFVWDVYEDRKGNMWLGTNNGLDVLSPGMNNITIYMNDPENPKSISSNRIFSVYEDDNGIYWIGSMGGGLNRFDPARREFTSFTEEQGLSNNVVYAVLDDGNDNLWLSTNWGLSKFNKVTEDFVNYDIRDGVQGNEFNAGAYYKAPDGEMFFGGMNGFNMFQPGEIKINRIPPKIVITAFRVFNDVIPREFEDGDTIRLRFDDNFFTFEFSALDFNNPSKNWYRYKLENYDREWITRDANQRYADYKRVNPGTYIFHVTGSNNDGVWNPKGIRIFVIINPPWWETWAFRIPFLLLVIALFWGFIYYRFVSIKRKHTVEKRMLEIERQVFELEQKSLRLQMNPHFIFNSLNAIQSMVISNETDAAVNYLAKFSHLMRMILANSTQAYIALKDELKALSYYLELERLRFDNKFNFYIDVDPGIDQEFIEIPPMLLQPYAENAIIHGLMHLKGNGRLDIKLRQEGDILICTLRDNGIGREEASRLREESGINRQPKGMLITKERIDILNKQSEKNFSVKVFDLKDESGNATGTMVEIHIQFHEI